jgi:uncharacterized protein (DUF2344 family)
MKNKKQMNKLALQTKLKRLMVAGGLATLVAVPLLFSNAGMRKVDAAQGDVKINSTNFPDKGFRKYISENIDLNKDGVLSKSEIKSVKTIYLGSASEVGGYTCKSLTGINIFTELQTLECSWNKLTKLDVSKNSKLEYLSCSDNKLTKLDVSKNTKLVELDCGSNKLTKLNISKNSKLMYLYCSWNKLTNLNISKNQDLRELVCSYNKLSKLDVTKNKKLNSLYCGDNKLSNLDVTKNKKLIRFDCRRNNLKQLNLRYNEWLAWLVCSENKITSLDTSHNKTLLHVECYNNKLTKLDFSASPLCDYVVCYANKLTEIILAEGIEITNDSYDQELANSIKIKNKKTKPMKTGEYIVLNADKGFCVFRITGSKQGKETVKCVYYATDMLQYREVFNYVTKNCKFGNKTYKVTAIGANAFKNVKFSDGWTDCESITIGNSVKTIGSKAFAGTEDLKYIILDESVEEIGSYAFANSKDLKVLKIKSTKLTSKTLNKNAFAGITSKTTVKVPKSKLSTYEKLFRKYGLSKNVKIKAI